jgi:hypothetical protein
MSMQRDGESEEENYSRRAEYENRTIIHFYCSKQDVLKRRKEGIIHIPILQTRSEQVTFLLPLLIINTIPQRNTAA